MRSSSVKSIVAVLSISVTVLAAVPTANARPAQGASKTQTTRTREEAPSNDRFAAVRELINRTLRRLGLQGGITIPVPRPTDPNAEQ
ncbi:MAG TPA: hypothetical protein VF432_20655 [Thermoanaerobaculia bacterium]